MVSAHRAINAGYKFLFPRPRNLMRNGSPTGSTQLAQGSRPCFTIQTIGSGVRLTSLEAKKMKKLWFLAPVAAQPIYGCGGSGTVNPNGRVSMTSGDQFSPQIVTVSPGGHCHLDQQRKRQSHCDRRCERSRFRRDPAKRYTGWPTIPVHYSCKHSLRNAHFLSRPLPRHCWRWNIARHRHGGRDQRSVEAAKWGPTHS
jgi:hypothetical protein